MKRRKPYASNNGTVLAEYLIASTLGIAVVLAAVAVMQHTNASYAWLQENAVMEEHANYALETIARAVKQAGYRDYVIPIAGYDAIPDGNFIHGADDRSMKSLSAALEELEANAINGSDVLAIHFSGSANKSDLSMINCAGFAVSRATSVSDDFGWSIFYVAKNTLGESELRCKYRGANQWQSQALIAGVESFQVLYGVDTDGDGFCNITLNATAIDDHDKRNEVMSHPNTAWWSRVVSVHVSLLLRAAHKSSQISKVEFIDLFGKDYADHFSQRDHGTHLPLHNLPSESQLRLRRVVRSVIYLSQPLTAFD